MKSSLKWYVSHQTVIEVETPIGPRADDLAPEWKELLAEAIQGWIDAH